MSRKNPLDLSRYRRRQILLILLVLSGVAIWNHFFGPQPTVGEQAILEAYRARQSNLMVEAEATVVKNLPDDQIEPRHQKMLLELPGGHSLLLAHNIDLAERVPAAEGDRLRFRGEYEYSEKGGVIHWTHHDPKKRHDDGWIEHAGRRFQ